MTTHYLIRRDGGDPIASATCVVDPHAALELVALFVDGTGSATIDAYRVESPEWNYGRMSQHWCPAVACCDPVDAVDSVGPSLLTTLPSPEFPACVHGIPATLESDIAYTVATGVNPDCLYCPATHPCESSNHEHAVVWADNYIDGSWRCDWCADI